jgi:magnesium-protoporphyrin O-methyltransferase
MSCGQCQGADRLFAGFHVRRELRSYRKRGPRATTRWLIDALKSEGVEGSTLLDIGGGIGVVQHELLRAGIEKATGAEAASAYLAAAQGEAQHQGHSDRIDYREGDFVDLSDELEPADIVTLDRVICCYHDVDSLVRLSAAKARRLYGVVYPRDNWLTKLGHVCLNFFLWAMRNPFRVFIHPSHLVEGIVQSAGMERRYYRQTPTWQVVVYSRRS